MMAHPYKRTAFLAGAATLALAVTACGDDGDMSDVIQGSGTASAVPGGTTASQSKTQPETETEAPSDKAEGRWLGAGESLTVDIPVLNRGKVTPEVVMDSLTVSNARVEKGDYGSEVCYDVSAHYKVTQKSEAGTGFDTDNPDLKETAKYASASIYQKVSLGFDKNPEQPLGFAEQLVYRTSSDADPLASFDLDKNIFSSTGCVRAAEIDDFSKMTAHASLSVFGANNNTSTEDKDVIGWELGSPKTA